MLQDSASPEQEKKLSEIGLFRAEAIEHARSGRFGTIVLLYPSYLRMTVVVMVLLTLAALALVGSFRYTSKVEVDGVILPRGGLLRIPAPRKGQLIQSNTSEGEQVKAGDVLFVIRNDSAEDTSPAMTRSLVQRRATAMQEKRELEARIAEQAQESTARLEQMAQQASDLKSEIEIQKNSVASAEASTQRFRELYAGRYVSQIDLNREEDAVVQAKLRLTELQRALSTMRQDVISEHAAQEDRERQSSSDLSKVADTLATLDLSDVESSFDQRQLIRAPVAGTVSGVTASTGQAVNDGKVLASIEPNGSELMVELYATSKSIGLIKPGQETWLRFEAYPYQTYGQSHGVVESVSQTAMQNDDFVTSGFNSLPAQLASQPVYRIRVRLKQQDVRLGSKSYPLRSGMLVQSLIPTQTRRLYQLVLDPLREIGGVSR